MPTKPKINVRLLRRIQKQIAKEPRQFDMGSYFTHDPCRIPNCGTACCIGGWAVTLAFGHKTPEQGRGRFGLYWSVKENARIALGLDFEQVDRLFYDNNWPTLFRRSYSETRKPELKAQAAIARIDHFIKTKGQQ